MVKKENHLENIIFGFFDRYWDTSRPVLLGLSGGPDSLALLYLLLKYQKKKKLSLHLAHVNHGMRKESEQEAAHLKKLAARYHLPWHYKRLNGEILRGNLEAAWRQERLKFFEQLSLQHHFQAAVLAHHADDHAETALKRILEGSPLSHLSGLQEVSTIQKLVIWRPMLLVSKREILRWLESHSLKGFEDNTNYDTRFLRGKFRTTILPYLSKTFGKEIRESLCRVARESQELRAYLDGQIAPYLEKASIGAMGTWMDLSHSFPQHCLEVKHLIRKLCETQRIFISHNILETIYRLFVSEKANRYVTVGQKKIYVDRKRIFFPNEEMNHIPKNHVPLHGERISYYGQWKVRVSRLKIPCRKQSCSSWKEMWMGQCYVTLPEGKYDLGIAKGNAALNKWWTNHKIPAFLRDKVPVIWGEQRNVVHEFLTGRKKQPEHPTEKMIKVHLSIK